MVRTIALDNDEARIDAVQASALAQALPIPRRVGIKYFLVRHRSQLNNNDLAWTLIG